MNAARNPTTAPFLGFGCFWGTARLMFTGKFRLRAVPATTSSTNEGTRSGGARNLCDLQSNKPIDPILVARLFTLQGWLAIARRIIPGHTRPQLLFDISDPPPIEGVDQVTKHGLIGPIRDGFSGASVSNPLASLDPWQRHPLPQFYESALSAHSDLFAPPQ